MSRLPLSMPGGKQLLFAYKGVFQRLVVLVETDKNGSLSFPRLASVPSERVGRSRAQGSKGQAISDSLINPQFGEPWYPHLRRPEKQGAVRLKLSFHQPRQRDPGQLHW